MVMLSSRPSRRRKPSWSTSGASASCSAVHRASVPNPKWQRAFGERWRTADGSDGRADSFSRLVGHGPEGQSQTSTEDGGSFDHHSRGHHRVPRPHGPAATPVGIAAGPDGNLWFTELNGKISTADRPTVRCLGFSLPVPRPPLGRRPNRWGEPLVAEPDLAHGERVRGGP